MLLSHGSSSSIWRYSSCIPHKGLPRWLSGKELAFQCRRHRFDPWIGKIPRRKRQPTPVLLPGQSHGQRSLADCSPCGRRVRHDLVTQQQQWIPYKMNFRLWRNYELIWFYNFNLIDKGTNWSTKRSNYLPQLIGRGNNILRAILSYVKRIASPGSMQETGCSGPVRWDDPEGWDGEGGRMGVQDGDRIYTRGGFTSMYGKTTTTL